MTNTNVLNEKLKSIFANGRIEVGLEVGSDQGLSPEQWVHIPRSFNRTWAYHNLAEPPNKPNVGEAADKLHGKQGWKVIQPGAKHVRVHNGKYFAVDTNGTNPDEMGSFYRQPFTVNDIKQFLSVNTGKVHDGELSVEQVAWVHAARFWAVAAGFIMGSKQTEWKFVDDAADTSAITEEQVSAVVDSMNTALTASAARAASWRKSNHATGGSPASGFARRWISKNAGWPNQPDINARRRAQELVTKAFYTATHASCVHPVLAMMAPGVTEHWAQLDPACGMIMSWDVLESTSIRIAPKTQVAGTAIVVDSMVVLKMLVAEGLAPLLESASKFDALARAYRQVEENGVRVATYANWFLAGHPDGLTRIPFAQKDSSFADLVGELGAVARTFYRQTTIGESLALDNAMLQLASETAKNRWTALTKARKSASDETVMAAYTRVMGATSSTALQSITSNDEDVVKVGVQAYNSVLVNMAAAIGVGDPVMLDEARILANMNAPAPTATIT